MPAPGCQTVPMREILRRTVGGLTSPSPEDRADASASRGSAEAHGRYQSGWTCLNEIELAPPAAGTAPTLNLIVAAWNVERCKHVEHSAGVIRQVGADVVLATELDHGMARSSQRHTTRDLAAALGFGYAYGVEFVELGTGDVHETREFAGQENLHGLHGNAILSRWPLEDVAVIPLDDGGYWYVQAPKNDGQYRVGGRMAVAARIATAAGPLLLVSVHLESESDAAGRAEQIDRLLSGLRTAYGDGPAVIGGDLNTNGFLREGLSGKTMLADPEPVEPCFAAFQADGFDWRACNTGGITTRRPPWAPADLPLKTLDWLFTRGVAATSPAVHAALSDTGDYLSDHELISARILT